MLERREAELREAMKLRHSLTTLLHAVRVDMEHVSKTGLFIQSFYFRLVNKLTMAIVSVTVSDQQDQLKNTYINKMITPQGLFCSCSEVSFV